MPIIDLTKSRQEVIEQLRYACEVVGFMQVMGHGVPEDLIERHDRLHRALFDLPDAVKGRLHLNAASPVRGYFGKGGEDLDQILAEKVDQSDKQRVAHQVRKDNKECIDLNGVPWSKPKGGFVAKVFGMPSRFPEELPDCRKVSEDYSAEMFRLCKELLGLMAEILGHPRDFFDKYLTNPVATLRLLHYWPIKDFTTEIGVGEHTDYGLLTILKQDHVGGLQVLNYKDKKWVHACPVANAFVVNIGDMLARWSGHQFKSTVHRVVNLSCEERYSVPFFLEPNLDTLITPGEIAGGLSEGSFPTDGQDDGGRDCVGNDEHARGCREMRWSQRLRSMGAPATAEDILERFYRGSGQLRDYPQA